ncbi:Crp/Fnr family transcriptional regulator [Cupriavidus basilensis]
MSTHPQSHEGDAAASGQFSAGLEALLRSHAMRRQLAKGEVLFTYGSNPDALFCVERGAIKASSTAQNGREAVLSLLEAGQWFGEGLAVYRCASRVRHPRRRARRRSAGDSRGHLPCADCTGTALADGIHATDLPALP